MENFGIKLKRARKEKKLTQQELADCLGLAKSTVRGYEQNRSKPRYEILLAICKLLGVSADYLMGLREDNVAVNVDKVTIGDNFGPDEFRADAFARNLKALMKERKLTHAALAEAVGVSRSSITQYTLGTKMPKVEHLRDIARYFGVSLDDLAGDGGGGKD